MAYGSGWEVSESAQFWESYEEHIAGDERLEDLIESFVWALRADSNAGPYRTNIVSTFWFTILIGPPPFFLFFDVDEINQVITLEFVTPTP